MAQKRVVSLALEVARVLKLNITAEKEPYSKWKLVEHFTNGEHVIKRYETAKELEAFLEGILWLKTGE